MSAKCFIDTNVWIYAHLRQPHDQRHTMALELINSQFDAVISAQVLAEYYNVMLRNKQSDAWIQNNLSGILGFVKLQAMDATVAQHSWFIRNRYGFSIWDSQIVAAALTADCQVLYSEDLQTSQRIETLLVINPFKTG